MAGYNSNPKPAVHGPDMMRYQDPQPMQMMKLSGFGSQGNQTQQNSDDEDVDNFGMDFAMKIKK